MISLAALVSAALYQYGGFRIARPRQKRTYRLLVGRESRQAYYAHFKFHHIYRAVEDYRMRDYVLSRTPGDRPPKLYIWGFRPAIYFLCGTVGPSRFCYNLPVRANWSPHEWLESLEQEVMADPPDFILVGLHDHFGWVVGNEQESKQIMPPWLRYELDRRFRCALRLKFIELWERDGVVGAGSRKKTRG